MDQNDAQIISEFEEIKNEATYTLAKLINLYGLSFSESRLFSFMFLENNPMTLDEMSKSLGMSKTSMSTGTRSLLDAQMVERKWKKGTRKDLYIVEDDLYKSFSNGLIEPWKSLIQHNTKEFKKILKQSESLLETAVEPDLKNSISLYAKRIHHIIAFYNWLLETLNEIQDNIDK